jgi:hypothetical protein
VDFQVGFNIAAGLTAFLGGWVMNNLRDSLKTLHEADASLTSKVQAIEVLVAGTYVKRDELDRLGQAIFAKLDRIEGKLDGKADK